MFQNPNFQNEMRKWLQDNFNILPEDINQFSSDEFDAFIIKLSMKECDEVGRDEQKAMFIAHILDYFVDNRP